MRLEFQCTSLMHSSQTSLHNQSSMKSVAYNSWLITVDASIHYIFTWWLILTNLLQFKAACIKFWFLIANPLAFVSRIPFLQSLSSDIFLHTSFWLAYLSLRLCPCPPQLPNFWCTVRWVQITMAPCSSPNSFNINEDWWSAREPLSFSPNLDWIDNCN